MFRKSIISVIKLYQRIISPDTGLLKMFFPFGACRFYPTCSEYGYQSIKEHGVVVGIFYTIRRILHCHPLAEGGYDPIIKKVK